MQKGRTAFRKGHAFTREIDDTNNNAPSHTNTKGHLRGVKNRDVLDTTLHSTDKRNIDDFRN